LISPIGDETLAGFSSTHTYRYFLIVARVHSLVGDGLKMLMKSGVFSLDEKEIKILVKNGQLEV